MAPTPPPLSSPSLSLAPPPPPTSPLVLRLPDPVPLTDDALVDPATIKGPWNRSRLCGYSGSCCIIAVIVVVCCVLLLAKALVASSSQAMRARSFLTVTVEVPATSLSSSLGAGLKCDFAVTLFNAQPSVSFDNIALDSFSLMDTNSAEVLISSTDVRAPHAL